MSEKEKTIIIADDDKTVRDGLRKYFKGYPEFHVAGECANGREAVELCLRIRPDIVLMDIEMPELDGIEAAARIIDEQAAGCILMLTSFSEPDYISKAIDAGASGYLVKPIMYGSLIPTLRLGLEHSRNLHIMKKNMNGLKKRSERRNVINDAKLFLMEDRGITEDEAFVMIRELSREKQVSMEQISEILLKRDPSRQSTPV